MLNVAIIGTGNIASAHIGAYLEFPGRCTITRLVDIYPEKAEQKKQEFHLDAQVFASHKAILDDDSIDLVSICTPPYCHGEIAVDFLNAGRNVIVEKPMAASLEECDAMLAAAERSGKLLSVIAQNRFRDPIMNLKRILDSGKIGKVVHAQIDSHWWRGHCYYDLWWRGCWDKEGGGCTLNHAVHHIDMLGWMLGLPDKVCSILANTSHDNAEVEDISVAVMKYPAGALAQVTSSVVHHGEEQQVILQGEKARISAPWKVCASLSKDNGFPEPNPALEQELEEYRASLPKLKHIGHAGQLDDVMTALETGGAPFITGKSGRLTIELITAIYKAGIQERTVTLPIAKEDPYYTTRGLLENAPRFHPKTQSQASLGSGDITLGAEYNEAT